MLNVIKRTLIDKTFLVTLILAIIALLVGHVKTTDVNFQTVYSLAALLITVAIYQELGILKHIAHYIVSKCSSSRTVFLVLMLCAFIGSMLLTNDVAILTLVPIFFNIKKYMHLPSMTTISLLTIFANLGSSVTPFGNPQNIYMVTFYKLSVSQFLSMSLLIGAIALSILFFSTLFIRSEKINISFDNDQTIDPKKLVILMILSIIVILGVLSIIPINIALLISILVCLFLSKEAFLHIDYAVILTFVNFFIVVGAISRVAFVQNLMTVSTQNPIATFISASITSQLISNVPAAVLLSKFTNNVYALFLGVSVGGLGTLIASLANLLALRQYSAYSRNHTNFKFFKTFTLINILFLIIFVLVGVSLLYLA
ncbi:SLC13 family permease [Leuconostoc sp. C2]|uniref:SLC13 family permease n=1 Tax=Leuconostoc sp. (strain C2) TaxID=979982 RepID=UPI0002174E5F|nr:SLC13 family permease [Leuconostoc sp. C2]AEJ31725.1 cation transport protein [Leuconostoc sp. C2]